MAHFNLENDISNLIRMDAPITKGPKMRWQRKLNDSCSLSRSSESILNSSSANSSTCQTSKTPMKSLNRSMGACAKTPGKTPNKTPGRKGSAKTPAKTPSGRNAKTPTALADRFIPNRGATQFDLAHHLMTKVSCGSGDEDSEESLSPSKREFRKAMNENLNGEAMNSKIIAYQQKAPAAPEGYQSNLKVLYSAASKSPHSTAKKTTRNIPQVPERILDAPEMLDDYYLNLLDWSSANHLAVCLGGHVYLWNAANGEINQLLEMENPEEYVSSVAWIKEGNYLAVGTSTAEVQLWDVERQKRLRCMSGHAARIGALSWNSYILSSGSRSGYIHHHDVRAAEHQVAALAGHSQEVCGLKWSPDGKYLASGGNDNLLNIWAAEAGQCYTGTQALYTLTQHQAAVKALAWCPWQPSLLASGGGTADRHIRFWNINNGSCVNSVDTKSQVCALLWSKEYKELVSSHGFAQNQLIIWKYPAMTKVAELTGHTARVLHMAMSPDGTTVMSAAADETLRLWKCFAVDPEKKKAMKSSKKADTTSMLRASIR